MQNKNKQRWMSLWQRIGAQGDPHIVYNDLVARYSEPHRAYHTIAHIQHCLNEFKKVRNLIANPDAAELALWYHDVIYNTRAKDNEEKSAALATAMIKSASLPNTLGQLVAECIMATKHTVVPANPDIQFLVDIDLSGLGQPKSKFDKNTRQIRKEYEWVPEDAFAAGRSAILQSFLNRPNIYATQFFRDKYETRARQNIARSLAQLSRHS